jgi:succinyl-CoA synthetase beta subunit
MGMVDYVEASKMAARYGLRTARAAYVYSADEAVRFAKGKPIVMKVISDKALHKTKSGVVLLGLKESNEIKNGFIALARKAAKMKPYKILVQEMVSGGTEAIIGGVVDNQFGKLVLLGMGGIYVEAFKDFSERICPIGRKEALSMISDLKSRKVLAPDKKAEDLMVSVVLKAAKMFYDSDLKELDLNPVIFHDGTYDLVDIRAIR